MIDYEACWRQGSILSGPSAHALDLLESPDSKSRAIIISHDCDLRSNETFVEIIVGSLVSNPDGMLMNSRHPRKLHLKLLSPSGEESYIELTCENRKIRDKKKFFGLAELEEFLFVSENDKRELKQWLATRYGRPAFPNSFESRLRKQIGQRTVEWHIARILKPVTMNIVGLFFDLDSDRHKELPNESPYFLSIYVVYDTSSDLVSAKTDAEDVAESLQQLFQNAFGQDEVTNRINLNSSIVVAESDFALVDIRRYDQWRVEYFSYRDNQVGNVLSAGT